ncbi:hypothetical protein OG741_37795 [Streptomyces sp. NBC_01410]
MNLEYPTWRTEDGFDAFDLTVDLVVDPDLARWQWRHNRPSPSRF